MDALLDQIKAQAAMTDDTGRESIQNKLRDLQYSIEAPEDTMRRIMFMNLHIATVRVGINLKIFDVLAKSNAHVELDQFVSSTGADPILLSRVLRFLASVGAITEVAKNSFAANNVTNTLAIEGYQSGVYHFFETVGPAYQDFPAFLAATNYRNPSDNTQTVFNSTFKTQSPGFIWLQQQPERSIHFNKFMAAQRQGTSTWLNVYPIADGARQWDSQNAVFVDVGGGFGHQCAALQAAYPDLPGQIILQDLPQATAHALPLPGVKIMTHDFFQPQPIKGAKYYYLRNILHDYPDEKCLAILSNLKAVMSGESRILVDEIVLPDTAASWQATQLDLTMMICLGAMERTQEQWRALYSSAGLKVLNTYPYNVSIHDSVVEIGLMDP